MGVDLLVSFTTAGWITVGTCGALIFGFFFYGVFRKFVRMAWTSWQILTVFALAMLLKVIHLPEGWGGFAFGAAYLFGVTALVLLSGRFLRRYMTRRTTSNVFLRAMNRILGAVTAVLNFAMLAAILGGFGLTVASAFVEIKAVENAVWAGYSNYLADLIVISVCVFFVRGGFRIGVARSVQTTTVLVLTVGALFLSMYLAVKVDFMHGWVTGIGASIAKGGMNTAVATLAAYLIIVALCFLIFFALIIVLGFFLKRPAHKSRSVRTPHPICGAVLSVVFYAVFLALTCGWDYVVSLLAGGNITGIFGFEVDSSAASDFALALENLFSASPLSSLFYHCNFFHLLFG